MLTFFKWLVPCVVAMLCLAGVASCGGLADGADTGLGSSTTPEAVVGALGKSGYRLRYRKVAQTEGFTTIAGTAYNRAGGSVAFSVMIQKDSPSPDNPDTPATGSPQPPVVRYSEAGGTTVVGNIAYETQAQSGFTKGHLETLGVTWLETHGETAMSIRLGVLLKFLFAPEVRGEG